MSVTSISKLSDHAAVLMRAREAKACIILVIEMDGQVSQGIIVEKCTPTEVQDALCEALVYNANRAMGVA